MENELTTEEINDRIKSEICYDTIDKLLDINLIEEYKQCISVKNQIKKFENLMIKHNIDTNKISDIIDDYLLDAIPPGTKGVIRGNKFNIIVKDYILNLELDLEKFIICFERKNDIYITSEIPDWYILEKSTNKIIIGMNQLDIWNGGHQINRGSKYLDNNMNNEKIKLLCVVCNYIHFKNKNKAFRLFQIGFTNNRLCYLNNLKNIIISYFH
jgi:hypothetical protein